MALKHSQKVMMARSFRRNSLFVLALMLCLLAAFSWFLLYRDTSLYAPGFSESSFSKVRIGMSVREVYSLLGEPVSISYENFPETWLYDRELHKVNSDTFKPYDRIEFDAKGVVATCFVEHHKRCRAGMSRQEVVAALGKPSKLAKASAKALYYSSPGSYGVHRARILEINDKGRVVNVVRYTTHD